MLNRSKRPITIVLALGIVVLIAAIALGERAGDRVIGQVTEKRLDSIAPVTVTPAPATKSGAPYGPDWKRTDVMSAATDPAFPDPRVPPAVVPTPAPAPKPTAAVMRATEQPTPSPTPDLNVPIWRRAAPLPSATPLGGGSPSPSPATAAPLPTPQP